MAFGIAGAGTLVYGGLVAASLAGGPLKPQQLLPFPELVNNIPVLVPTPEPAEPGTNTTPPANHPGTAAKRLPGAAKPGAAGTTAPPAVLPQPGVPSTVPTTANPPVAEATTSAPPAPVPTTTQPPRPSPEPTTGPPPQPSPTQTEGTALPAETQGASPSAIVPVGGSPSASGDVSPA
ncbi:hypothetical protein KZZ52_07025 [Dactylosporangium sp. AC04546]|uniref:hypothetical protein n=1 Tax=Dactylosporangium sp. AC04546 TaxID=2862460 RepID=UPI001EE0D551|nr:hypothetical protein [Dactylosporangium sp. AC04546]WVK85147.1 hypothetical protein KZZ52_07025 [Dactylosporangium sp. AC04546]